ncbi:MAG: PIN domain-containing protein [Acidobacteria bacterium]|nr:PIN domain-containing protein [Acidobacteriota bacterium]
MIQLLDVNVLIALAWPNHVHHGAARSWFARWRATGWATCAMTEAGFVRVSCNPSAVKQSVTPAEAIALLSRLRQLESHTYWAMDRSITALPSAILARIQGHRQITDAMLVALAMQYGGQLATFDAGLADLLTTEARRSIRTIPV